MANLTANKHRINPQGTQHAYVDQRRAADSQEIYDGAIVCYDSAGRITRGGDTAGLRFAGIARARVTSGSSTTEEVPFEWGHFEEFAINGSDLTAADVGRLAYAEDDQLVTGEAGSANKVAIGRITGFRAGFVTVHVGELAPLAASGTYTPTLAGVTNVDGTPTASLAYFTRVGDIVRVDAIVSVDPTSGSSASTVASLTLPFASNLGATDLVGVAASPGTIRSGTVAGDAASDTARLTFLANGTTAETFHLSFTYRVIPA